ncbi:MAG: hypothetical protein BV458_05975 [Thermoplasmata archaeon M9B2D]|nr:MAG: hypothetical protein BV458_05975 [Thermoplasmata archaeon M9B2D]
MNKKQSIEGGKCTVVFITVLFLIASVSIPVLASDEQHTDIVSMTYLFPTPSVSRIPIKDNHYDQILLQDAPCSGQPGEPFLPTKGAYLLLPPNSTVQSITISGEKHFLGSGFHIVPCGKSLPLTQVANENTETIPVPDPVIYSSHVSYPRHLYTEVGTYSFRGYSILVLMLHPVQYIPNTGDVYYYSAMNVAVCLKEETQQQSLYRCLPQDLDELHTKIQNPTIVSTYESLSPNTLLEDQYDLLILTTDDLHDGFLPLAAKHNETGTRTIIKTLSDVGGSTPEDIREYLQTAYMTLGIRYVLLGGDAEVIPAKMLWVEGMDENVTYYETTMPSDLYYACLDGPYNYNGNDKWGEPTDGEDGGDVDLIADVYVGRACVDTIDDVNNFVQKTVEYLSLIPTETYLGDVTLAGEYLGDYGIASYAGTYLDQMVNSSSDDGYTTVGIPADQYVINKLYDAPGYYWPKSAIISLINNGVHIINHLGHASYDYNMKMYISDVSAFINENNFCFVYSQGCMSGGFDNGDCIAEYFTVKNTHGAFAGIWNARYGWFWSYSTDGDSQRFHRQFWDAVFGENIKEIGRANHDSKEDNLFLIQRSCIRWVYYETNLFGDPAVAFVNASGIKPQLRVSDVKGGRNRIQASIFNEGEGPVRNIPWNISIRGGLLGFINLSSVGSLESLAMGNTTTIQPELPLLGLGKISIQVRVKYAAEWNGKGFVLGPYILRVLPDR